MTADSSNHTPPPRQPIDLETYAILQECGFDEALLRQTFDPQAPSVPVTLRPYVPRPEVRRADVPQPALLPRAP